jgi:Ulp1 family protease
MDRLIKTDNGYNFKNVVKWSKNLNVFNLNRIFFPINVSNSHWTLAVILIELKELWYFDSLLDKGNNFLENLLKWLEDESKNKKYKNMTPPFNKNEWSKKSLGNFQPSQGKNETCCGVFACACADYLSDDLQLVYNLQSIPQFRIKIGTDIIRGKLLYEI